MGEGGKQNVQVLDLEIIPAILTKEREVFIENIEKVKEFVNEIHIDIMDNKFVPNQTIEPGKVELPKGVKYQFHWMVEDPEKWIEKVPGDHLHQVHVESVKDWGMIKDSVKKAGGRLCIVLNPGTSIEKIIPYVEDTERIMVMCVVPGYSHQKYIVAMNQKIERLRERYPDMEIEVDGGVDFETIKQASKAGADKFVSCSTVFGAPDLKEAVEKLKKNAYEARGLEYEN